jgi:hypothetical protein
MQKFDVPSLERVFRGWVCYNRQYNTLADSLLKEALGKRLWWRSFEEVVVSSGSSFIFYLFLLWYHSLRRLFFAHQLFYFGWL